MPQELPVTVLRERTLGVLPVTGLVADAGSGRTLGCGLCFIKVKARLPPSAYDHALCNQGRRQFLIDSLAQLFLEFFAAPNA